jgi:hypothetical protein
MKSFKKGVTMEPTIVDPKNFKFKQQALTELNSDGNEGIGEEGEAINGDVEHDKCGTPECCGTCDTADVTDG